MFGHRHAHDDRRHARGGMFGGRFGGGRHDGHDHRGRGGRIGRFFDHGDLRYVLLGLIAERPRHGYELIKAIEEKFGGMYSPSPGVVYPTLTMLEDMGYAKANVDEAGRKLYAITPEGQSFLNENKAQVDAMFARFDGDNQADMAGAGSVLRAMLNLRASVKLRLRGRQATREQVQAIADVLDEAAKKIERI